MRVSGMWNGFDPESYFAGALDGCGITHIVGGFLPDRLLEANCPPGGRGLVFYSGESGNEPYQKFWDRFPEAIELSFRTTDLERRRVWFPALTHMAKQLTAPRKTQAHQWGSRRDSIGFLCSNLYNWSGDGRPLVGWRGDFSYRLREAGYPVDSAGSKFANMHRSRKDQTVDFIRSRRFMLCLENTALPGYFTEKAPSSWLSGALPVYAGATDYLDYVMSGAVLKIDTDTRADQLAVQLSGMSESEWNERTSLPLLRPHMANHAKLVNEMIREVLL